MSLSLLSSNRTLRQTCSWKLHTEMQGSLVSINFDREFLFVHDLDIVVRCVEARRNN